jgi:hypothetical protein
LDLAPLRGAVEAIRPAVAAFLEHAEGRMEADHLLLTFLPKHSFFKKSVEMPANMEALQKAAATLFGADLPVRLGLEERAGAAPPPPPRESDSRRRERLMEVARDEPAVRSLASVFGAEIVDIKPLEAADEPSQQESEP